MGEEGGDKKGSVLEHVRAACRTSFNKLLQLLNIFEHQKGLVLEHVRAVYKTTFKICCLHFRAYRTPFDNLFFATLIGIMSEILM